MKRFVSSGLVNGIAFPVSHCGGDVEVLQAPEPGKYSTESKVLVQCHSCKHSFLVFAQWIRVGNSEAAARKRHERTVQRIEVKQ